MFFVINDAYIGPIFIKKLSLLAIHLFMLANYTAMTFILALLLYLMMYFFQESNRFFV